MQTTTLIATLVLCLTIVQGKPKPGIFYTFPAPESHTSVFRDGLGNQATAYSYHDGHSSSVHVSRNDHHYVPTYPVVPAHHPVVYDHQPAVYAPAAEYHHASFYEQPYY